MWGYIRNVFLGIKPFLFPLFLVILALHIGIILLFKNSFSLGFSIQSSISYEIQILVLYIMIRVGIRLFTSYVLEKAITVSNPKKVKVPWFYVATSALSLLVLSNFELLDLTGFSRIMVLISLIGTLGISILSYFQQYKALKIQSN